MDAVVRDALTLAESGHARQAYEMLEPLEVTRAGDPDFDTVFGIAANLAGEYARAVMALERATIVQPGNTRARAELGRAMFAVGDSKSARTLLQQAKDQGAPAQAALRIDQLLRAIDVAESLTQSSWQGYVEAAYGHDSNITNGPPDANVAVPLFGGNVTLSPNSVKKSASFANLAAGVTGRYVLDSRWSLIGNASANDRVDIDASQFSNNQFNVGAGASYRVDRQEFSVLAVHEDYRVDGAMNRIQDGMVGEWVYRADDQQEMGAYLQYSKLRYPGQSTRNAARTVVGLSYARRLGGSWLGWGGVYVGGENETAPGVPFFGQELGGLRLGVQKAFADALSGFVAFNYENRRYGGQDPFFLVKRKDEQSNLSVGLNWVPAKSWRITPQITYVRNQSNVKINDYNRTIVSVAARYAF
ncbi:MAG: surface lipoprotein assembly modifier [Burkholderiaceae bacterium]